MEHGLDSVTRNAVIGRKELERIRTQGYAVDNEGRVEGIRCIDAPIRTDGEVVGAVSVSAPKS